MKGYSGVLAFFAVVHVLSSFWGFRCFWVESFVLFVGGFLVLYVAYGLQFWYRDLCEARRVALGLC